MLEQQIEKNVIDKLQSALDDAGIQRVAITGAWQPGAKKAVEPDEVDGIVTVKANPRAYEGYTTPDANFVITVTVALRADVDYSGNGYLDVCEKLFDVLQKWQTDFSECEEDLAVDGKFEPAGLVIDGGDAGIDADREVWTCRQQVTVYGIITA